MSETQPPSKSRLTFFSVCVILLLLAQAFFSWTHGRLLYRQQQEISGLREEVQRLADALEGEAPTDLEEDVDSFSVGSFEMGARGGGMAQSGFRTTDMGLALLVGLLAGLGGSWLFLKRRV